jgi:glutaredoxin-related protein
MFFKPKSYFFFLFRLKQLTHKEPVMLFMKGTPGAEKCGFSRTITSLLTDKGVKYGVRV